MELLTKTGHGILLDDADWVLVKRHTWRAAKAKSGLWYASTNVERPNWTCRNDRYTTVRMHQLILGVSGETPVDHRNGNGLDNRRENIRVSTSQQNAANRRKVSSNRRYKGVSFHHGTWRAEIGGKKNRRVLNGFPTPEDAARAYNKYAIEMYGEFARLNDLP